MKTKNNLLAKGTLLALLLGAFSIPLLAQDKHEGMMRIGRKGEAKFTSPLRVGETVLKPGTYIFQHKVEGEDHIVIFERAGKEVARVKCTLEPLGQKAQQTALHTRAGDGGETILIAVEVRGENVKHVI